MINANKGWLFAAEEIKNAPSIREGMSFEEENDYRRNGCHLLWQVGIKLKLKENPTLSTACTFFHRFYMVKSFQQYPYEISALGCLFLAGKVEETPKKCKDIVAVAKDVDDRFDSRTLLNEIFVFEKTLLVTLGFDLYIENPYTALLTYAKTFLTGNVDIKKYVQFAWTLLNDCAGTTLCLQYEAEIIAVSILELSFKYYENDGNNLLNSRDKKEGNKWYSQFIENLNQEIIDNVCHIATNCYE